MRKKLSVSIQNLDLGRAGLAAKTAVQGKPPFEIQVFAVIQMSVLIYRDLWKLMETSHGTSVTDQTQTQLLSYNESDDIPREHITRCAPEHCRSYLAKTTN
jgi:hypothetical protein